MTEALSTSHKRMLSKIKAELTDEEKQGLVTELKNMQAAIKAICDQYDSSVTAENPDKGPILIELADELSDPDRYESNK